ncbi:MAG: hypothetical protein II350_07210 [Clostridia bacterium]|nr:hypothetical protein [Clostridia bacterium]
MMFDNSTLEAYRAVKAPESLRVKVLEAASAPSEKKRMGTVISFKSVRSLGIVAAACLLLVFGAWGGFGGGVSVVESSSDSGVSFAREIGSQEFDFELLQRGFCKVRVSCGELVLGDRTGAEISVFGKETVKWNVPCDLDEDAELTVLRYGKETVYRLVKNADSGEFDIYPAE